MEITKPEREIDDISDRRNKNEETFFKKPGQIRVRLFVKTTGEDISDSVAGLKVEKSGDGAGGEGECGENGV